MLPSSGYFELLHTQTQRRLFPGRRVCNGDHLADSSPHERHAAIYEAYWTAESKRFAPNTGELVMEGIGILINEFDCTLLYLLYIIFSWMQRYASSQ